MRLSLKQRFDKYVKRTPECWLWFGHTDRNGYGQIGVPATSNPTGRYSKVSTHRVAWFLAYGSWPSTGLHVCHKCDVPKCVNPLHLFLGTNADNRADMMAKGRYNLNSKLGENNGRSKLTWALVAKLREESRNGVPRRQLGIKYGIGRTQVAEICRNLSWRIAE
jgi:hypothetical protein